MSTRAQCASESARTRTMSRIDFVYICVKIACQPFKENKASSLKKRRVEDRYRPRSRWPCKRWIHARQSNHTFRNPRRYSLAHTSSQCQERSERTHSVVLSIGRWPLVLLVFPTVQNYAIITWVRADFYIYG